MKMKDLLNIVDKREKAAEEKFKAIRQEHKCNNCLWGKWQSDQKVICSFSNCVKDKLK